MENKNTINISLISITIVFLILAIFVDHTSVFSSYHIKASSTEANPSKNISTKKLTAPVNEDVWITVFVHGSVSYLLRKVDLNTIFNIAFDSVENTIYSRTSELIRQSPYFRSAQPMQDLGLQIIDKTAFAPGKAATAVAHLFDQIDTWTTGRAPEKNLYYTFGWDGLVSPTLRLKNAHTFYEQLFSEVQRLKSLGIQHPKIRIYTFSHGGWLSLLMGTVHEERQPHEQLLINELIMLGSPVHADMLPLTHSPLFQKIYNISSPGDSVQLLDLTRLSFSHRVFTPKKNMPLPQNLTQIKLIITRNSPTHKPLENAVDQRYNFSNQRILNGNSNLLCNASPGHTELWFFQWVNNNYRDIFPLAPLSTLIIIPLIIETIKNSGSTLQEKNIVIDIRPDQNVIIIKKGENYTVVDFFDKQQLSELKTIAKTYEVSSNSHLEFDKQGKLAFQQAKQERALKRTPSVS